MNQDTKARSRIKQVNSQLQSVISAIPNKATSSPTSGTYTLTQIVYNSNPTAGGYLGWVCITGGTANNTAWTGTTEYSVGNLVYANGKVYRCKTAGTSSSTAPSHTSSDATDGTVTWTYIDILAVFKGFGLIQS